MAFIDPDSQQARAMLQAPGGARVTEVAATDGADVPFWTARGLEMRGLGLGLKDAGRGAVQAGLGAGEYLSKAANYMGIPAPDLSGVYNDYTRSVDAARAAENPYAPGSPEAAYIDRGRMVGQAVPALASLAGGPGGMMARLAAGAALGGAQYVPAESNQSHTGNALLGAMLGGGTRALGGLVGRSAGAIGSIPEAVSQLGSSPLSVRGALGAASRMIGAGNPYVGFSNAFGGLGNLAAAGATSPGMNQPNAVPHWPTLPEISANPEIATQMQYQQAVEGLGAGLLAPIPNGAGESDVTYGGMITDPGAIARETMNRVPVDQSAVDQRLARESKLRSDEFSRNMLEPVVRAQQQLAMTNLTNQLRDAQGVNSYLPKDQQLMRAATPMYEYGKDFAGVGSIAPQETMVSKNAADQFDKFGNAKTHEGYMYDWRGYAPNGHYRADRDFRLVPSTQAVIQYGGGGNSGGMVGSAADSPRANLKYFMNVRAAERAQTYQERRQSQIMNLMAQQQQANQVQDLYQRMLAAQVGNTLLSGYLQGDGMKQNVPQGYDMQSVMGVPYNQMGPQQ